MNSLPSTLEAVTVYREGATCRRRAEVPAGPELQLRFAGLPMSLEPGSLRARVTSGAGRVVDVRPQFDVQLAEASDAPAEQQARDAAAEALEALQAERARLDREIAELEGLQPAFLEQEPGTPPRPAPVEAMLALGDFRDAQLKERLAARRELEPKLRDAQQEYTLRQRRLVEASSAKRGESARLSRVAVVTLAEAPAEALQLELEYAVPGARWVPNYALTLDRSLGAGTLTMRASVAQHTGEDWAGVSLALSTAESKRRADLPELKALKIGRRQEEPQRSGWREPPPGLDALFDAYDTAAGARPTPPKGAVSFGGLRDEAHGEEASVRVKAKPRQTAPMRPPAAPPPPPPPRAMPAPMPVAASMAAPAPMMVMERSAAKKSAPPRGASRSGSADGRMREEADEPAPMEEYADEGGDFEGAALGGAPMDLDDAALEPAARLNEDLGDYARLQMMGPDAGSRRGRLAPAPPFAFAFAAGVSVKVEFVMEAVLLIQDAAANVRSLPLPALCSPAFPVRSFDYRYDCAARADVPSTGKWTQVQVMQCAVGLAPEYVCVPSVEPKVYRTLTVSNRSSHALLPGPVDVTAGDEFLMTTQLPAIPPGANESHRLGLGVEEGIKVARKTQMNETTGGFLGGSTVLPHDVSIELNNRLASPALVEVRERVPVPEGTEKDLKVEEAKVEPPWEKVETPIDGRVVAGARRWRVTVPPGQTLKLAAQYAIRMPADRMLVGGNRRS